jgi:lysophospholipase L1-like esterase
MRGGASLPLIVLCGALVVTCSSDSPSSSAPAVTSATASSPTSSPTPTAAASVRYVAIGASDTVGLGAIDPTTGSWPARIAARLPAGAAYTNLGVSGSLALQAGAEQLPGAIAQRPTIVTVWLAVNDLNATITPDSYADDLARIIDALVARTEATIFVGNVPDLRAVPVYASVDPAALLARITAYNDVIAAVAATSPGRVAAVDLFTGSADLVSSATVARDGFHPSDAGYQLIADRFAAAMRAKGVPVRG